MDSTIDSTFELPELRSRWFALVPRASSSAPEATRSHFTRSEATSERSRGRSKPLRSAIEATPGLFDLSGSHLESLLELSRSHWTRENMMKRSKKLSKKLRSS